MKTTNDIKSIDQTNIRIFISNIAGKKTRVSVVNNPDARNYKDGDVLFQKVYAAWNRIPESDVAEIEYLAK